MGKAKKIVLICIVGHVVFTFSALGLVFLRMWSPWDKKSIIEHYSNGDNYIHARGLVSSSKIYSHYYLNFEWVKDELSDRPIFDLAEVLFLVWLADVETAVERCDPLINKEVSFMYCEGHYMQCTLPNSIVQLSFGETEYLSYEEGKAALLQYITS